MGRILQIASFSLLFFLQNQGFATAFAPKPFTESIHEASIIVRGKSLESYTQWATNSSGEKAIYTYTEIQPTEILKGNISSTRPIYVRELGGEKDGIGMLIDSAAKFKKGEDTVVLLAAANEDGSHDIMNLMMGKLLVKRNTQDEEYLDGPALYSQPPQESKDWPLQKLRSTIGSNRSETKTQKSSIIAASTVTTASPSPSPSATTRAATPENDSGDKTWLLVALVAGITLGTLLLKRFLNSRDSSES